MIRENTDYLQNGKEKGYVPVCPVFQVNKYIELRLENGATNIYVNNERFRQCKYLLMNIPVDKINSYDDIKSIDEAAERLDCSLELNSSALYNLIPPETEFWGHCSNLQVWAENGYDTRLLHSNLAFPLLKGLVEARDPQAKRIFKEEIAKRFCGNSFKVKMFLLLENYLMYLTKEELDSLQTDLRELREEIANIILARPFTNSELLFFLDRDEWERIVQKFLHQITQGERTLNNQDFKEFWAIDRDFLNSKYHKGFIYFILQKHYYPVLREFLYLYLHEIFPIRDHSIPFLKGIFQQKRRGKLINSFYMDWGQLGNIYNEIGSWEEIYRHRELKKLALKAYKKALKEDPQNEIIREKIQTISKEVFALKKLRKMFLGPCLHLIREIGLDIIIREKNKTIRNEFSTLFRVEKTRLKQIKEIKKQIRGIKKVKK